MGEEGMNRTIFPGLIMRLCDADKRYWRSFGGRENIPVGEIQEWFIAYCGNPSAYILRGEGTGHVNHIQSDAEKPGEAVTGATATLKPGKTNQTM